MSARPAAAGQRGRAAGLLLLEVFSCAGDARAEPDTAVGYGRAAQNNL